jgi:hypothetical protein
MRWLRRRREHGRPGRFCRSRRGRARRRRTCRRLPVQRASSVEGAGRHASPRACLGGPCVVPPVVSRWCPAAACSREAPGRVPCSTCHPVSIYIDGHCVLGCHVESREGKRTRPGTRRRVGRRYAVHFGREVATRSARKMGSEVRKSLAYQSNVVGDTARDGALRRSLRDAVAGIATPSLFRTDDPASAPTMLRTQVEALRRICGGKCDRQRPCCVPPNSSRRLTPLRPKHSLARSRAADLLQAPDDSCPPTRITR